MYLSIYQRKEQITVKIKEENFFIQHRDLFRYVPLQNIKMFSVVDDILELILITRYLISIFEKKIIFIYEKI